jgi:hypothetical protein
VRKHCTTPHLVQASAGLLGQDITSVPQFLDCHFDLRLVPQSWHPADMQNVGGKSKSTVLYAV